VSALLFLPGTRTDRVQAALDSGAAIVCIDLEDAVEAEAKDDAREAVRGVLVERAGERLPAVRVNHPDTDEGRADLRMLTEVDFQGAVLTLLIPKVGGPNDVSTVLAARPDARIIPVIETNLGLSRAEDIAQADGVVALQFGGLDLSVELGCALEWEPLLYARSRSVHAARLAGIGIIDTPFFDLADDSGLKDAIAKARSLGFTAKAAIHPSQVPFIERGFTPSDDEIARARHIVDAFERDGRGAIALDGMMIDRPMVIAARRLLAEVDARSDVA
jgi:citrate lyase beta subunit